MVAAVRGVGGWGGGGLGGWVECSRFGGLLWVGEAMGNHAATTMHLRASCTYVCACVVPLLLLLLHVRSNERCGHWLSACGRNDVASNPRPPPSHQPTHPPIHAPHRPRHTPHRRAMPPPLPPPPPATLPINDLGYQQLSAAGRQALETHLTTPPPTALASSPLATALPSRLTIIITTSPVRSNPDTLVLRRVVHSFARVPGLVVRSPSHPPTHPPTHLHITSSSSKAYALIHPPTFSLLNPFVLLLSPTDLLKQDCPKLLICDGFKVVPTGSKYKKGKIIQEEVR